MAEWFFLDFWQSWKTIRETIVNEYCRVDKNFVLAQRMIAIWSNEISTSERNMMKNHEKNDDSHLSPVFDPSNSFLLLGDKQKNKKGIDAG